MKGFEKENAPREDGKFMYDCERVEVEQVMQDSMKHAGINRKREKVLNIIRSLCSLALKDKPVLAYCLKCSATNGIIIHTIM